MLAKPSQSTVGRLFLVPFTPDLISFSLGGEKPPRLLLDEPRFFDLGVKEFLQYVGTLVVLAFRRVVFTTVCEDALHVGHEQLARGVVPVLQTLAHRLQICESK